MIPQKTNEAINKIVAMAFNGNAIFDNISYNLDVTFNMPTASEIVHKKVAHWLPAQFGDDIQTFQSQRGVKPIRPTVESQTKTYGTYVECFADAMKFFTDFENAFKVAIETADAEKAIDARIFLENNYTRLFIFTKQMMIWNGKAIEHNENIGAQSFDNNFEKFTII